MQCREIKRSEGIESDRRVLVCVGLSEKALGPNPGGMLAWDVWSPSRRTLRRVMVNTEGREVSDKHGSTCKVSRLWQGLWILFYM